MRTSQLPGHTDSIVVMGVSGCGKSTLGAALAEALAMPLIEGDDFHSRANVQKMHQGIALTDEDRAGWLDALARELAAHPDGAVLACSALKRSYRERLRRAVPRLRFVFMQLDRAEAQRRVSARAGHHFFSPTLVEDQFATLEVPSAEPLVLTVDATAETSKLVAQTLDWLRKTAGE